MHQAMPLVCGESTSVFAAEFACARSFLPQRTTLDTTSHRSADRSKGLLSLCSSWLNVSMPGSKNIPFAGIRSVGPMWCDLRVGLPCAMWSGLTALHPSDRSHGHLLVRALASREECALDQYQVSQYPGHRYRSPTCPFRLQYGRQYCSVCVHQHENYTPSAPFVLRCQTFRPMPAMWSVPFLHACKYSIQLLFIPAHRRALELRSRLPQSIYVVWQCTLQITPCRAWSGHTPPIARRPSEMVVDGFFRLYAARMMASSL